MRSLVLSNMRWSHRTQTNRQYAARALSEFGRVSYAELVGRGGHKWEVVEDVLVTRMQPWLPWSSRPYLPTRKAREILASRWKDRVIEYLGGRPDLIITFDPMSLGIARLFEPSVLVYDCVDIYETQPWFSSPPSRLSLRLAERRLSRAADLVTATAPGLIEHLRRYHTDAVYLAGSVLPPIWADEPLPDRMPGRRFVYVGALDSYKVDFDSLHRIASTPDSELLIVGHRENMAAGAGEVADLNRRPNVTMLGAVAREDLWPILRDADVGVISLARGAYSKGSFPLKVWDYLWAGLPVMAVGAASLAGLHEDVHVVQEVVPAHVEKILSEAKRRRERRDCAAAWTSRNRIGRIIELAQEVR